MGTSFFKCIAKRSVLIFFLINHHTIIMHILMRAAGQAAYWFEAAAYFNENLELSFFKNP